MKKLQLNLVSLESYEQLVKKGEDIWLVQIGGQGKNGAVCNIVVKTGEFYYELLSKPCQRVKPLDTSDWTSETNVWAVDFDGKGYRIYHINQGVVEIKSQEMTRLADRLQLHENLTHLACDLFLSKCSRDLIYFDGKFGYIHSLALSQDPSPYFPAGVVAVPGSTCVAILYRYYHQGSPDNSATYMRVFDYKSGKVVANVGSLNSQ